MLIAGLLAALLASSACGFRLRGAIELPPELQQTVAEGVAPYSDLGLAMSQAWNQSDASLQFAGQREGGADMRLVITRNEVTRRVLSVDSAGRPNEYELQYQLGFDLQAADGSPLLAPQSITQYREYRFDPANVLAKSDEEARLKKDMVREAVAQMLRRISRQLKNRPAVEPASPATSAAETDETAR